MEDLKSEFFRKFGNESFRGYPLEQCHLIFNWFKPYIQKQNDGDDIIDFLEWIDTENDWSRDGLKWYRYDVNFGEITIKHEELYKEFLNSKTK